MLSNIFLHEVDRQWCGSNNVATGDVRLVRFADDMVLLARTEQQARVAWEHLQTQFAALRLVVNQEKSRLTQVEEGFAFLGFEFRQAAGRDGFVNELLNGFEFGSRKFGRDGASGRGKPRPYKGM